MLFQVWEMIPMELKKFHKVGLPQLSTNMPSIGIFQGQIWEEYLNLQWVKRLLIQKGLGRQKAQRSLYDLFLALFFIHI